MVTWDSHIWVELGMLSLAFVLSVAVGLERSRRQKSAGLRTHVLVGLGSAMFTLVSAFGFSGIVGPDVAVDPSRIAAQVVSGIGFLGAGIIFVRNNMVSGLTSAATIWVVAAIGMACGASMPVLAIAGTLLHLLTVGPLSRVSDRVRPTPERLRVTIRYLPEQRVLRAVLEEGDAQGVPTILLGATRIPGEADMQATLEFAGLASESERSSLLEAISNLSDVRSVLVLGQSDEE